MIRGKVGGPEDPYCRLHYVGVQGSGFRVSGLGFRVPGLGFRVQGLGFRVFPCFTSPFEATVFEGYVRILYDLYRKLLWGRVVFGPGSSVVKTFSETALKPTRHIRHT